MMLFGHVVSFGHRGLPRNSCWDLLPSGTAGENRRCPLIFRDFDPDVQRLRTKVNVFLTHVQPFANF
ncbi:hypothetical protein ARZXY2_416 [Arthrobacter sp. ZXY-2]|nr:hypothetical protein ARZXY2_416 [Arthrobacter sp. ZXY-2]